jgi:DNA-binding MarR family transcriptional regulator
MPDLLQRGRDLSTATVLFFTAISERAGLNATETKTLDLLIRRGPQTAGRIGAATGLTSASVTSLIDGLERKGFARRTRDAADRRKVIVEAIPESVARYADLFQQHGPDWPALLNAYSDAELRIIRRYMTEAAEALERATERLSDSAG